MGLKENIKSKRFERGLTLEEVSVKIGVSKQTVQKYESGVISNIPSDKIELLATALGTTPACLMGWEDVPETVLSAGVIDMGAELRALLSKIESANDLKFDNMEMSNAAAAMSKNSLEGLIQNLELIVGK